MAQRINTTIEDVLRYGPAGGLDTAMGSVFYGINHRQTPAAIPLNKDNYGLVFFTRPQLNLSTENIRAERFLGPLLTKQDASIQRIIRMYLDPRLGAQDKAIMSPFVDNKNAFMSLLTNHCISCTGWQDVLLDTYTSQPGAYREVYTQTDGVFKNYTTYDISATFRSMPGDPILMLMLIWQFYQAAVFEGKLVPYPDFLVQNEIDYNTRIYRLVLDHTKQYVQKIACTGASFPINTPIGNSFNFETTDGPLNMSNKEFTIQFKSVGARYMDDIVLHDFNKVVGIFNPDMRGSGVAKNKAMTKVHMSELYLFNNMGYPYIEPNTKELQWYVATADYNRVKSTYNRHMDALFEATLNN